MECNVFSNICLRESLVFHRTDFSNRITRDITIRNKSFFRNKSFSRWFQNNINCILCLFVNVGNIISYEQFITYQSFWTPPKEFNKVVKAKSPGLVHPDISHCRFTPNSSVDIHSALLLEGVSLLHKRKISSRGKLYWRSLVEDIDWNKTWLLPGKYCSSNKVTKSFKIFTWNFWLIQVFLNYWTSTSSVLSSNKQRIH